MFSISKGGWNILHKVSFCGGKKKSVFVEAEKIPWKRLIHKGFCKLGKVWGRWESKKKTDAIVIWNVLMKTFETFYLHFSAEIEKLLNAHTEIYSKID